MTAALLTSEDFAHLTGLHERSARKVFEKQRYQGQPIAVVEMTATLGRGGIQKFVLVDSLPQRLKDRLNASETDFEDLSVLGLSDRQIHEVKTRFQILKPLIGLKLRSPERTAKVNELIGMEFIDHNGEFQRVTPKRIEKWDARYRKDGLIGLASTKRSDTGTKRVLISREWDKAVDFDDATRDEIRREMDTHIKQSFKAGATVGTVWDLANRRLADLTWAHGFRGLDRDALREVCQISKEIVEMHSKFRRVHEFKRDHKKFSDNAPYQDRSIKGVAPNEVWVADVHIFDIQVEVGGKVKTPHYIAFMDWATRMVFGEIVFYYGKASPNNVDVIQAFVNAVQQFGCPQHLIVDNGSEYKWVDWLHDALKLGIRITNDEDPFSPIHRAQPHHPQAKPIEALFRVLEEQNLPVIRGHIGGQRHNSKKAKPGKTVAPHSDFETLVEDIEAAIGYYNTRSQSGKLKVSPIKAMKQALKKGWHPVGFETDQLLRVFTTEQKVRLAKHQFSFRGQKWSCLELAQCFDKYVLIRAPKFHHFTHIEVLDMQRNRIGYATIKEQYHPLDKRGAIKASEMKRLRLQAIRDMDASVPDRDLIEDYKRIAAEEPIPQLPAPVAVIKPDQDIYGQVLPFMQEGRRKTEEDRQAEEQAELLRDWGFDGTWAEWMLLTHAEQMAVRQKTMTENEGKSC